MKCYPLRSQYNKSNGNVVYSLGGFSSAFYKNDDHRGVLYNRSSFEYNGRYYIVPLEG
jgi:hypothetical protein